jgi:hypothetical protein
MVMVVLPAPTVAEPLVAAWLATFDPGLKVGRLNPAKPTLAVKDEHSLVERDR